jgi:hypothetical protein
MCTRHRAVSRMTEEGKETADRWPESFVRLAGAWKDFPTAEEMREDQIDLEILKAWLKKRAAGQAETITLEQLIQELEDENQQGA